MRKWLNAYFDFSKQEFNGLLVLIVLIVLISATPYLYRFLKPEPDNFVTEQLAIKRLILPVKKSAVFNDGKLKYNAKKEHHYSLFVFDPNTINVDDWQRLGLSFKQSAAILKYLEKGGKFRKAEDLKKMYTITEKMYERLSPYVRIEDKYTENTKVPEKNFKNNAQNPISREQKIIEINGADSTALIEVKGIGPAFAMRIIKYRERIGGFYRKEQLLEVFGLDSVKYDEIRSQVYVDDQKLKRINVNAARIEDFKGHPYIRYKQINAIIEYRKQHGNYSNIADLNKVAILDPETVGRLAPYLTF
nr:helix-hairpin-helix domain-containing protein [uncultured Pedobacter sp.]